MSAKKMRYLLREVVILEKQVKLTVYCDKHYFLKLFNFTALHYKILAYTLCYITNIFVRGCRDVYVYNNNNDIKMC